MASAHDELKQNQQQKGKGQCLITWKLNILLTYGSKKQF